MNNQYTPKVQRSGVVKILNKLSDIQSAIEPDEPAIEYLNRSKEVPPFGLSLDESLHEIQMYLYRVLDDLEGVDNDKS